MRTSISHVAPSVVLGRSPFGLYVIGFNPRYFRVVRVSHVRDDVTQTASKQVDRRSFLPEVDGATNRIALSNRYRNDLIRRQSVDRNNSRSSFFARFHESRTRDFASKTSRLTVANTCDAADSDF